MYSALTAMCGGSSVYLYCSGCRCCFVSTGGCGGDRTTLDVEARCCSVAELEPLELMRAVVAVSPVVYATAVAGDGWCNVPAAEDSGWGQRTLY